MQEAIIAKWDCGEVKKKSIAIIARDTRILSLVADYESRETLSFLKGMAYNFDF